MRWSSTPATSAGHARSTRRSRASGSRRSTTRAPLSLSGGQRRRLDFGLALIGDPELLFLDEPTTGFDPSARRAAWDVIDGLRGLGKTIFLTTHYMEEAERLADRVAVIADGRSWPEGTPATLGGRDRAGRHDQFHAAAGSIGERPSNRAHGTTPHQRHDDHPAQ